MIKEVLFDIDDTLYDYEKGHALGVERMAEYAEKEFGIAKAYFRSEYKRMNEGPSGKGRRSHPQPQHPPAEPAGAVGQAPVSPCGEAVSSVLGRSACREQGGAGKYRGHTGASENGHRRGNRHGYDLLDAVSEAGAIWICTLYHPYGDQPGGGP